MSKHLHVRPVLITLIALLCLAVGAGTVLADFSHVVRAGETLYSIGRRYGVSPNSIAAANCLANPNYIWIGQVLRIPSGRGYAPGPAPSYGPSSWQPHGGWRPPRGDVAVTAWVSNAAPSQYSDVTVFGRITRGGVGIPGVPMNVTWSERTSLTSCSGWSGWDGWAFCSRAIGGAMPGYYVGVQVVFSYQGQLYSATTGFTPR
jgi:LysM repeat protein